MIRNIEGNEFENMKTSLDHFTHIKIHLTKKESHYEGLVYWPFKEERFPYLIKKRGLVDS